VLPTLHKRFLGAVFAASLGLLAAAPAHAATAPKIKAAYAVDGDRDGHVDGVSLKWSTRVRGGYDAQAPFAVSVRGYRVTRVDAAIGKTQRVHVAERGQCDTGGSVRLNFAGKRRGAVAVKAARGKRAARSHKLDMRRFDIPVPRITCAVTLDADANGRVDGVRVTYSRDVRSRRQTSGRFLFSVAGYRVTRVNAARGRFLKIALAERGPVDSDSKPAIGYSRPSRKKQRKFSVRSGKRGDAFAGTFTSTRDGVSPRLVAAETGDDDRDGLLDAMTVRFSEPVLVEGGSAFSVLGMQVTTARANGAAVAVKLAENTARGDALPGASIAGPGVMDLSGNTALQGAVSPTDAAPPVMVAALTHDLAGKAGHIDAVSVAFSEPVAHPRDAGGAYPFLLSDRQVTSVEPASGSSLQVRIAEGNASDTGERPSVRYIPGAGFPVADLAGNQAAEGFVTSVDGVAPVLMSASTEDEDSDGRIDGSLLRFSESVQHGAEGGGSSFAVAGHGLTGAGAANGADIALTVMEAGAADSGATPTVTYTRDGVEDVRDAAGNATQSSSLEAQDGARPVLLAVQTADVDDDGRIDRLASTWSESLNHGDDSTAPFAVSASGFSVARVRAASGQSLTIDLVEPSGYDTGSRPALAYAGGADRILDEGGLEPQKQTWSGLTADALNPRLVSATTGDTDADGELDSVSVGFSEPVVHAQEISQASFAAAPFTILSAEAASGSTVELKLQQSGSADTGARPPVTYAPDGQEDVRDAAGNFAAAATIPQATDGARPVLLSAATADVDDNGRLDRVATGWSEPLDHPDDSAAPFPVSLEQFGVTRVHAAAGQTMNIDLAEPSAPDTGSAPDVTYVGGASPVRDISGLEPAQVTHSSLTRDALPPRRVGTATADADSDGRIDTIDIEWSEQVTGSTPSGPYTVAGRTLGANVSFSGATTRVPFAEDGGQFDTHATPNVSYDAGTGDLHDVAEGTGDSTEDAPSVAAETPLDKAAPVLVAAKTADLSTPGGGNVPNGTIDAVLTTFSEPISHSPDGFAPFSLNVASRTETNIEGDSGAGDRTLYVQVTEAASPDGGLTPNVSVQAVGPAGDRIKDRAAAPNEALAMTFGGTTDEVSPVLLAAQLGERPGGACTKDAVSGIDGEVDCVLTTWSEQVEHATDAAAPYSLSSSGWAIDGGGIGQLGPSATLEIPLTASTVKDRDSLGTTVSYNGAEDTPVVDSAAVPNEALNGTKTAEAACKDVGLEGNDARNPGNPQLTTTDPSFQRKCAFDDDWYRLDTDGTGYLELLTRPASGVDLDFELYDPAGNPVAPSLIEETGGAGQTDRRQYTPLSPNATYWVRVTATEAPTPNEGPYCVVFSDDVGDEAGCGPLAGQIVFTEVGLGNDKFVEIKNDFDVPVDMSTASAELVVGDQATERRCTLDMPDGLGGAMIDPEEHVIIQQSKSVTAFGCDVINSLGPAGETLSLEAGGNIDVVDFTGVIDSAVATEHSLQFVPDAVIPDTDANNDVDTNWCRTFAADSKGADGDGCDEYRLNEVLWRPTSSSATSDGRAFVEIAGNIPALPASELLGGWVLRGVNGLTGDGTADFVLGTGASPRSNGTYVIADGVSGVTQVSQSDTVWDGLDLSSPQWPPGSTVAGPRGLQLIRPNPGNDPPCTGSADAFGWTTTAQGFSNPLDNLRACPGVEGQEYTTSTVGASAARDNLSSAGDITYNANNDTSTNKIDFCPQATPNPAALNIRPTC
jgi:hypothetical protein